MHLRGGIWTVRQIPELDFGKEKAAMSAADDLGLLSKSSIESTIQINGSDDPQER